MDKHYQLYVGKYVDLPDQKYSYYSPNIIDEDGKPNGYLLVYATELPHESMREVPLKNEQNLKADELAWLRKCKLAVNTQVVKEKMEDYIPILNDFADLLDKELERQLQMEKEKANGENS